MLMKKNEIYEIEITDVNNLGNGVGRIEGRTVFVPSAVDGDRLLVKIIKVASDYAVARIESVIESSAHRVASDCPYSVRCGGCVYRALSYEHELCLKRSYVGTAFKKAGLSPKVMPVAHGETEHYRNKVQYPVGEGMKAGFFANHSHSVIPISACLLEDSSFGPIVEFTTEYLAKKGVTPYSEKTGKGLLRHVYLRGSRATGQIMVCLVINGGKSFNKCTDVVCTAGELFSVYHKTDHDLPCRP